MREPEEGEMRRKAALGPSYGEGKTDSRTPEDGRAKEEALRRGFLGPVLVGPLRSHPP